MPSVSFFGGKNTHAQLVCYFEVNTLIIDTQYGYRSGCSTECVSIKLAVRIDTQYGYRSGCSTECASIKLTVRIDTQYGYRSGCSTECVSIKLTVRIDTQYGYRSGCSTECASIKLTVSIYNHLGNCQVPFAIFLDLLKAFDTLDHTIYLHKVDHYGIRGMTKQLFESYITNRQ